jgi:hypothetical protein
LFCEWAYIVNPHTELLEVYCGGQTEAHRDGRYAKPKPAAWAPQYPGQRFYYPVRLVRQYPLTLGGLPSRDELAALQEA